MVVYLKNMDLNSWCFLFKNKNFKGEKYESDNKFRQS